jgi:hypothetical protein
LTTLYAPPRSPTEEKLATVWTSILSLDRVGIHDNFFDLGGHSLLASQLVVRVQRTLGVELRLRSVFEAPTIAELAPIVDMLTRGEPVPVEAPTIALSEVPPIEKTNQRDGIPVMSSQSKMWRMLQVVPTSHALNLPFYARLRGPLDVRSLGRALTEIVRRHEILRFTFAKGVDGPVAAISPAGSLSLPETELRDVASVDREAVAEGIAQAEWETGFDAALGPLVRSKLLTFDDDDHVLLLTFSHLVFDGSSYAVFVPELTMLYEAFRAGRPSPLPPVDVQFADIALWEHRCIRAGILEPQMAYWRKKLDGAPPPVNLHPDRALAPGLNLEGTSLFVDIPASETKRLRFLGRSEGASHFMTLLTVFAALHHRSSGQEDVVVLVAEANRARPQMQGLIASAVEALPLRFDLSGRPTFRQALRRVRDSALEAYEHRCALLSTELFRRGLDGIFVNHLTRRPRLSIQSLEASQVPVHDNTALTPLALFFLEKEEGMTLRLRYSTQRYDEQSIARLAREFQAIVTMAAAEPDRRILSR